MSKTSTMKNLLSVSFITGSILFSLFIHAQQASVTGNKAKTSNTKNAGNMRGAYYMLKQVVSDGTMDSVLQNEQLKIYTDRYFMYAHGIVGDSLAEYGIGTYKTEDDKLVEYVFYTSANGDQKDTIDLYITKRPDGYTQVINFSPDELGRTTALTEDYKKVSRTVTSPLDGAWKQTKNMFYPTQGAVITNEVPTQFKVYMAGHFIWANTSKDSATQKPVSYFGFGTFDMKGKNEVVENVTHSSNRNIVYQPVSLRIELSGKDSYTQTITWPEGRSVEVYQRMK
jgi:hypothetical protein